MKLIRLLLLLFFLTTSYGFAQEQISGLVTDADGVALPGVTVIVKGESRGTTTDFNGSYTISEVETSDVLVFSYVGFQTEEVPVFEQRAINVTMQADQVALEEVVVIGYDVVRRKDVTGAVSTIDPEELSITATANFDQALAGRTAGLQVTSNDGTPGGAREIVIRGGNSITGDNSPLYVIDGIPLEDFDPSSINTRDIKSFDVLKDASATAIYGSRGANGVIVITTKGGRTDGKTDINLSSHTWVQSIGTRMEVMNPYEYAKYMEKIAYANDNYVPGQNIRIFETNWIDPELYRYKEGTDWQDEIFRTAYATNHTLSVRAGNEKTSFYYSGNYLDQQGTLITTKFKKINNRLKFTHKVGADFKINGQIAYSNIKNQGLQVSGNQRTSVIRDAISFRPIDPINWTSEDESVIQDQDPYLYNPVKTLENTQRKVTRDDLFGTLGFNYKFLDNFTLDVRGNFRTVMEKRSIFFEEDTQQASRTNRGIHGSINEIRWNTFSTSSTLKYDNKIGKSRFGGLIGMETQNRTREASSLENRNLPTDEFGIHNLGIATTATVAGTSYSANSLLSFFGRLNYSFDNRYLATVNFRADGSSKFRDENRWGYFPSFSLAWRLSEEEFLQSVEVISDLKIRGGWGVTGNNRIGDFEAYNIFAVSTGSGYVLGPNQEFSPGAFQSNMAVPDLRWETTAQVNLGIDLELLQRFNLTVDYYKKNTRDLLLDADMALSTGFDRVQQNVGEVSNEGVEFSLSSRNIQTDQFRWDTDFNISFNRTNTERLNRGQEELLIDPSWDAQFMQSEYQYVTRVGEPVGMMYGLEYDGLYQVSDFLLTPEGDYQLKEGLPSYRTAMRPGMVKFKDLNGDGVIDQEDRTIIGNPHPKHIGGLSNSFTYKSFDFQFLLQWAYDFDILNGNLSEFGSIYKQRRNGLRSLNNIWTPTNPDTNIGGMRFDGVNLTTPYGYKLDTRHIEDGSYLKLQSIVLGYSLNDSVLEKLSLKKCRFSIALQNVYTWTDYSGYDPDVSVGRFGALTPRLDYSAYPQSITVSGGIELTF